LTLKLALISESKYEQYIVTLKFFSLKNKELEN